MRQTVESHVDFRWECVWVRTVEFRLGSLSASNGNRTPLGLVQSPSVLSVPYAPSPTTSGMETLKERTSVVPGPDRELLRGFRHLKNRLQVWSLSEYPDFKVGEAQYDVVPLQLSEVVVSGWFQDVARTLDQEGCCLGKRRGFRRVFTMVEGCWSKRRVKTTGSPSNVVD